VKPIWDYVMHLGAVLGGGVVLWILGGSIASTFRDWRFLGGVQIHDRMTRERIADVLNGLTTPIMRTRFTRLLSDRRVVATGTWPDGFRLSARRDPAITQLGKLEERWLGLDR
jgi:hypothetical protein